MRCSAAGPRRVFRTRATASSSSALRRLAGQGAEVGVEAAGQDGRAEGGRESRRPCAGSARRRRDRRGGGAPWGGRASRCSPSPWRRAGSRCNPRPCSRGRGAGISTKSRPASAAPEITRSAPSRDQSAAQINAWAPKAGVALLEDSVVMSAILPLRSPRNRPPNPRPPATTPPARRPRPCSSPVLLRSRLPGRT